MSSRAGNGRQTLILDNFQPYIYFPTKVKGCLSNSTIHCDRRRPGRTQIPLPLYSLIGDPSGIGCNINSTSP